MTPKVHTQNIVAHLSNQGGMTSFRADGQNIRFRTPDSLLRYTKVKLWDNGYIVVDALYKNLGEIEDYIDLVPILDNLHVDKTTFLGKIKGVEIDYD